MHDITHQSLWRALAGTTLALIAFSLMSGLLTEGPWWPVTMNMMTFTVIPILAVALSADPGRWLGLFMRKRRRRLDIDTPIGAVGPFDHYHALTLSEDLAFDLIQGGLLHLGGAFKIPQGAVLHLKTGVTTFVDEPRFSLTLELTDAHHEPLSNVPWTRGSQLTQFETPMHPDKEPAVYWAAWTACAKAGITLKTPRGTFTPAQMQLGAEDRLRAQLDWLDGPRLDGARLDGARLDGARPDELQRETREAPPNTTPRPLSAPLCVRHGDRETLYKFTDGTAPEARWASSLSPEDPQHGSAFAALHMPPEPSDNLERKIARERLKVEIKALRVFVICSLLGMVTAPLALYVLLAHSRRPRHRRTLRLSPRWMRLDRTLYSISSIRMVSAFPVHKGPIMLITDDGAAMIAGLTDYDERVAWGRHFIQSALKHMSVSSTASLDPAATPHEANAALASVQPHTIKPPRWHDLTRLGVNILAPGVIQAALTAVTLILMALVCQLHMGWLRPWWLFHRLGLDYMISMPPQSWCPMISFGLVVALMSKCLGLSGRLSLANGLHTFSCVAAAFVLTGLSQSQDNFAGETLSKAYTRPTLSPHHTISEVLREYDKAQGSVTHMDLRELDMTDASCEGLHMVQVNLNGVQGRGARFQQAMLTGARLNDAHFHRASFERASLTGVDAQRAIFHESTLNGADMSAARLHHAVLTKANAAYTNFKGANLSGADLSGAKLTGADMRNVQAQQADFHGADMRNTNLAGAHLIGANLSGADLSGAALTGARIPPDKLSEARLSDTTRCPNGQLAGPERRCDP